MTTPAHRDRHTGQDSPHDTDVHAAGVSDVLTQALNTDPQLHSVFWNPGPGTRGVLARTNPLTDSSTPEPYMVLTQPGEAFITGTAPDEVSYDVTHLTQGSQLRDDGVLDLTVNILYASRTAEEQVPITTEMCMVLSVAARCWQAGSRAELRVMGLDQNDATVVTFTPDQGGAVDVRSFSGRLEQDHEAVNAVNYHRHLPLTSPSGIDRLVLPARLLPNLQTLTAQVSRHSGQTGIQHHWNERGQYERASEYSPTR